MNLTDMRIQIFIIVTDVTYLRNKKLKKIKILLKKLRGAGGGLKYY